MDALLELFIYKISRLLLLACVQSDKIASNPTVKAETKAILQMQTMAYLQKQDETEEPLLATGMPRAYQLNAAQRRDSQSFRMAILKTHILVQINFISPSAGK